MVLSQRRRSSVGGLGGRGAGGGVSSPTSAAGGPRSRRGGGMTMSRRSRSSSGTVIGISDCRVLIVSHKPIMIAAAAPLPVAIRLWMARQEPAGRLWCADRGVSSGWCGEIAHHGDSCPIRRRKPRPGRQVHFEPGRARRPPRQGLAAQLRCPACSSTIRSSAVTAAAAGGSARTSSRMCRAHWR
jgi:hypothetical protein